MVSRPYSPLLPFRTPATQANTEVAIESVPINGVLLKRVEFRENVSTLLSPGRNQSIRNTKVSVKRSLTVLCLVGRLVGFF